MSAAGAERARPGDALDLTAELSSLLDDRLPVLVLAPHPDDFDCVAATMELVHKAGFCIELAVLTGAASGVDDGFCSPATDEHKAAVREAEQRESCRLFGLPDERLRFLYLEEGGDGHPVVDATNIERIRRVWGEVAPGAVFLPHPDDSNAGHRRTHRMFASMIAAAEGTALVFLNEDPKTRAMRTMAYTPFGPEVAARKAELLRSHRSQHTRNLETRGCGLDERILGVNRRAAMQLGLAQPYAEAFELERWIDGRSASPD